MPDSGIAIAKSNQAPNKNYSNLSPHFEWAIEPSNLSNDSLDASNRILNNDESWLQIPTLQTRISDAASLDTLK